MYDTLYKAWQKERESADIQKLPEDFYEKVAEYLARIRREGRMLDRNSAKAKLVSQELKNARRLVEELARRRFTKMAKQTISTKPLKSDTLAPEEQKMFAGLEPVHEGFRSFLKDMLRGKISQIEASGKSTKRTMLRFLKEAPAIVGVDLKIYGPFQVEDVASLPTENANALTKRGVAMEIETG